MHVLQYKTEFRVLFQINRKKCNLERRNYNANLVRLDIVEKRIVKKRNSPFLRTWIYYTGRVLVNDWQTPPPQKEQFSFFGPK